MKLLALPLLFLLFAAPDALAMRCGSNLVTEGMRDLQVRQRCGEPFWTDAYSRVEVLGARSPHEYQRSVRFDVWYYNFGPRQFMRRFVFRDGELVTEDALDYGFDQVGGNCNPMRDYRGLSAGELYARCGEPVSRRVIDDAVVRRPSPDVELWRDLRREEWTYDFGAARDLRILHLVDGRVQETETRAR